eukprot:10918492-Karenia_brevis.AAC.1
MANFGSDSPAACVKQAVTPGSIQVLDGNISRARLRRRGVDGRVEQIYGPRRGEKRKAEEDLNAIRAAAQGPDAWSDMAAEARRLQDQSVFEGRVA